MDLHTLERNKEMQTLREELKHLSGRNSMLEDLFKGRDPQMQTFLKEAPTLIELTKKDHELIEQSSEAVTALVKTMNEFVGSFNKLSIMKQ